LVLPDLQPRRHTIADFDFTPRAKEVGNAQPVRASVYKRNVTNRSTPGAAARALRHVSVSSSINNLPQFVTQNPQGTVFASGSMVHIKECAVSGRPWLGTRKQ
jgi:hypothetical protein